MGARRRWALASVAVVVLGIGYMGSAATPAGESISPLRPAVHWSGGPLNGGATGFAGVGQYDCVDGVSCDTYALTVEVPPSYWSAHPGGVAVRIDWTSDADWLGLHIFKGADEIAGSGNTNQFGGTNEELFLPEPAAGTYEVLVEGFLAAGATYNGVARIVSQQPPQAHAERNTMTFAPSLTDPQLFGAEPSNWVADDGTVYVAAQWGGPSTGLLWRSDDGGATFRLLNAGIDGFPSPERGPCRTSGTEGADEAITSDRTGRVYFADLGAANLLTAYSTDRGDTWKSCNKLGGPQLDPDRQWLAPAPSADDGPAVDAYLADKEFLPVGVLAGVRRVRPMEITMNVTTDGGATWHQAGKPYAPRLVAQTGPVFVAADGTVYQVFEGIDRTVRIARSTNHAASFEVFIVSQRIGPPGNVFVSGAVDAAGTVYAVWIDQGTNAVMMSYSKDRAVHWTEPSRISPPGTVAVLPWVAARDAGDVAVSWLGATGTFARPELAPDTTEWRPWVARTLQGGTPEARYEVAAMSPTPTHIGPVNVLIGTRMPPLDYFTIAIAPNGAVIGTFDDEDQAAFGTSNANPEPYVVVSRQTSGLGMKRSTSRLRRAPPTIRQLELTSTPSSIWTGGRVDVMFALGSAAQLQDALSATVGATDAYWLVLWKAAYAREYAVMHVDRTGTIEFYGGDKPAPELGTSTGTWGYAGYPPPSATTTSFAIDGSVDPGTGRVTLHLDPARYRLAKDEPLQQLQAFSATGITSQRTGYTSLNVADATTARIALPVAARPSSVSGRTASHPTTGGSSLPATGVDDRSAYVLGAALLALAVAVARRTWAIRRSS